MIETVVKRMLKREHTNSRGDGICPWCHVNGCDPKCDFGILRKLLGNHREPPSPDQLELL